MSHTMYQSTLDSPVSNMSNAVVAFFSSLPAYISAVIDQSPASGLLAVVLPFVFFFLGKGIDIAVRVYLDRRAEKKRLNGIKDDSTRN